MSPRFGFVGLWSTVLLAAQLVWAHCDVLAQPRAAVACASAKHRLLREYRNHAVFGRSTEPPTPAVPQVLTAAAADDDLVNSSSSSRVPTCTIAAAHGGSSRRPDSPLLCAAADDDEALALASTRSTALATTPRPTSSSAETDSLLGTDSDSAGSPPFDVRFAVSSSSTESPASAAAAAAKPLFSTMPGRKLSVFPIGLIIFGSFNSIALLATAYMHWERRRYARQFVERKLQEKEQDLMRHATLFVAN
ncbi:hypothetical protein JCM3774_002778 [Rhodotorula dairenensis]